MNFFLFKRYSELEMIQGVLGSGRARAGAGSRSIFFIADSDRETSETWRNHFFGKSLFAKFRDFRA